MTAPASEVCNCSRAGGQLSAADEAAQHIERTCRAVVGGRRAARVLTSWSRQFDLNEPDFQVLWTLRLVAPECLDQATLAGRLVLSPAQVSATVERLRARSWIVRTPSWNDRRRNLWQLTIQGQRTLERILAEAERLPHGQAAVDTPVVMHVSGTADREEAA